MAGSKSRKRGKNQRPLQARQNSRSAKEQSQIKQRSQRIVRGKLDVKKLPTLMKSRIDGKITDAITMDDGPVQSFAWTDNSGRNLLVKRKNDVGNLVRDIDRALEAIMLSDNDQLQDSLPDKLTIELGPNDTVQSISNRIKGIDPNLLDRVEFIGGGRQGQVFSKMRSELEAASKDRFSNKAYREILSLLEQAITAENDTESIEQIDLMITLLDQIDARIQKSKSSNRSVKDDRNTALDRLKVEVDKQRKVLLQEFSRKLGSVQRTPTEVLVQLLSAANKAPVIDGDQQTLHILQTTLKNRLLQHQLGLADTRSRFA